MDGIQSIYIYIFPEYTRIEDGERLPWRGFFESECNHAVPRTSNLLRFLSFLLGHTMHTGTLHPPSPSWPPANEHGGHSPTVRQSPSSYAFFMGQLGKVGFLPVEISDWCWLVFFHFSGSLSLSLLRDTIHKIVLGFLYQPLRENFFRLF